MDWFTSYLTNRNLFVEFKGINSKTQNIYYGVPQGSVLGPLLFILYTNDLPNTLSNSKAILFADDTTIYYSNKDIKTLYTNINKDLIVLNDWFKTNKLSLNVSKTQYILFNKKRQTHINEELKILIGQENVNKVECTKFLGLFIDQNLDWNKHIQHCKSKISSGIYAINVTKNVLSPSHAKMLYYSLIFPYLTHGKYVRMINKAVYN